MSYSMITESWRWNILMQRTGQFMVSKPARENNLPSHTQVMSAKVSPFQRIVLANQPRLLREMLGRVFSITPGLQVVAEVDDPAHLPAVISHSQANWLIVTLDGDNAALPTPNRVKDSSFLSLMAISADGKQIEVHTTTADGHAQSYTLYDISLSNLLAILS